jgi:hypothetical protein
VEVYHELISQHQMQAAMDVLSKPENTRGTCLVKFLQLLASV